MPVECTMFGRVVWGVPGKATIKKDQKTKQPIMKDGKPVEQWIFGLAIERQRFENEIWPLMAQEAATGYPNGVPQGFSWKYKDGNSVDRNGKPYADRDGWAGHYVVTIATEAFAPPIYKRNANGGFTQITADQVKTGDYVAVATTMKVNVPTDRTHTPGLYINPSAIEHVAYGQAIIGGADPDELFGNQQYQLPAGASMTPQAPAGNVGMPGQMPQQQQQPGGYQQPMPGQMPQQQPGGYQQPMPGQMPQQQQQPGGYQQPMPGQMPQQQPGGYQQPMPGQMPQQQQQPGGYQQPMPGQMPQQQQQQPGGYQQPMPGQMPQQQPGGYQQPMPGQMPPPATGFAAGAPAGMPQQQPMPGQMPGMMPGMMPGR